MTGEMNKSEVTREAFPLHFNVARKFKGEVRPFDVYQGPYVFISGKGRYWLCSDNGIAAYWYDQSREKMSELFIPDIRGASTRAFSKLIKES